MSVRLDKNITDLINVTTGKNLVGKYTFNYLFEDCQ